MSQALGAKGSLHWLVNLALLVALTTCTALALRKYYSNRNLPNKPPNIGPSARVSIAGVDFSKSSETVLLAVAKDCHYCTESARFYRRLVQGLSEARDLRIIAISPDAPSDCQWYLNTLGISINEVKQVHLSSLGVRNVPTVVVVDRSGIVKNVWIGKLPPKTESEVMRAIGMKDARPTTDWLVDRQEVERLLKRGENVVLLDLRERDEYARQHFPSSINIPFDELNARAQNELSRDATIVLFSDDGAVADSSYLILARQEFPRVLIFDSRK